jgi:hypothetical protein
VILPENGITSAKSPQYVPAAWARQTANRVKPLGFITETAIIEMETGTDSETDTETLTETEIEKETLYGHGQRHIQKQKQK